jgi:hypothetical protein
VAQRSAIIAALAATLAALSSTAAAATPAPRTTTAPAAAAAGWLAQQFTDHLDFPGSAYFDGGATADAVFALAAAGSGRTKIDAAMQYFAAHVDDYTNLQDTDGKPGPYDGSVAKTAVAAFVARLDPRSFGGHDLIAALHTDECTKVSAPKNAQDYTTPTCPAVGAARNIYSSVSESFAILAEGRAASAYGASLGPDSAARAYFLSLQCPDGGFTVGTTGGSGCASDVDATAYAVMALQTLGSSAAGKLAAAVHWLTTEQHSGGYWVSQGGPNVDSTGLAAAALNGVGHDTPTARAWLAAQQVTTGPTVGAGASRGALAYEGSYNASTAVKATSDGILGLATNGSLAVLTDARATPDTAVLALAAPTLSPAQVRQGGSARVTGTGFSRGETVSARLGDVTAGSATAGANGTVTIQLTVKASERAGKHLLTLTGASSRLSSSTSLVVTPAAAPSSGSKQPTVPAPGSASSAPMLAATGTPDVGGLLAAGGGLVALGGLVLLLGRRKRA